MALIPAGGTVAVTGSAGFIGGWVVKCFWVWVIMFVPARNVNEDRLVFLYYARLRHRQTDAACQI